MQPVRYVSFLVRLWCELGADMPAGDWRGEIEHIQSGGCWSFSTLDDALQCLRRIVEHPEAAVNDSSEP